MILKGRSLKELVIAWVGYNQHGGLQEQAVGGNTYIILQRPLFSIRNTLHSVPSPVRGESKFPDRN
jgi:hypothetical protein